MNLKYWKDWKDWTDDDLVDYRESRSHFQNWIENWFDVLVRLARLLRVKIVGRRRKLSSSSLYRHWLRRSCLSVALMMIVRC